MERLREWLVIVRCVLKILEELVLEKIVFDVVCDVVI